MALFGKKQKPKPYHKPKKTLQQIYTDAINSEFRKNPELLKRIAFKEAGHTDLLEAEDPIKARERDIKKKMLDRAFAKIDSDPALIDRFTERQIEELIGAPKPEEPEDYDDRSPVQRLLQELEDYEELKKKLGGSHETGLSKLLDKDVILEALKLLRGISTEKAPQSRYVIQIDGQQRTVSEAEFKVLVAQGNLVPVAAIAAAKPADKPATKEPPETVPDIPRLEIPATPLSEISLVAPDSELPDVLRGLNFGELVQLLDKSPQEVVDMLAEDVRGQVLLTVLGNMTYDGIVEKLSPYREHSVVGPYVQRILDPKTKPWAEELLKITKELGYGGV